MGTLSQEVRTDVLCGRICDLEAENAKLREQGARLFDKTLELATENAKLRELLCELYEDQCDDGDRWKYRDRMSKFGIEVD